MTRKLGPSWKQSTGHTSTQSVYLHFTQGSVTTNVILAPYGRLKLQLLSKLLGISTCNPSRSFTLAARSFLLRRTIVIKRTISNYIQNWDRGGILNTVLITGGAGFIGSHTVDLLLENGFNVRVLDNFSNGSKTNLPADHSNLEIIEGDITDVSDVNTAMDGVDQCIHLAAQVSVVSSVEDASHSAQQNILGFVNIIEAIRKNKIARLVYASSAAAYGNPVELPLSESSLLVPESPYGLEKKINEQYADLFYTLHQMSACGLRYFNVYGPRQDPKSPYAGVIALFVERIKNKQPLTIFR